MPNECYTYFKITGSFDPDEITRRLGLQPYETEPRRLHPLLGTPIPADWCACLCDDYTPYVEEQMRRTIAPLLDQTHALNALQREFGAECWLMIVPTIRKDEPTPCLAPPMDVIDFCHSTRTQIDIDLYIEGD